MNLVWHIAKKDLRHMAVPTLLWLGFVVAGAIWFRTMPRPEQWEPVGLLNAAVTWTRMIVSMQIIVGFVLAGATVLEDPVVGSTQFWATRPIRNARLFAAKIVSTGLLFVVAPVLVLCPVWLASGFAFTQLLWAAGEFILWQAAFTLYALTMAAITPDLARFLGTAIGLPIVFGVSLLPGFLPKALQPAMSVWSAREFVILRCIPLMILAVLLHQYLTRRTTRTWAMMGLGFALVLAVRLALPWDVRPLLARLYVQIRGAAETPEDRNVAIAIDRIAGAENERFIYRESGPPYLLTEVKHVSSADRVYLPVTGDGHLSLADGTGGWVGLSLGRSVPSSMVREAALGKNFSSSVERNLLIDDRSGLELRLRPGRAEFQGEVVTALFRASVFGKLPVREAAELATGASRIRIVAVEADKETGRPLAILVEECDARLGLLEGQLNSKPGLNALGRSRGRFEGYVLVGPAADSAEVLPMTEAGSVHMNSMLIGYRRLALPDGIKGRDLEGSSLVKVRFTEDHRFRRAVEKQSVPVFAGERSQ